MTSPERQDKSLYRAKVTAGWLSVMFMAGLLWVAVNRGPNQSYVPLVAFVLVALVIGLVIGMRRHARRERIEREWRPKAPVLGALLTVAGVLSWVIGRSRRKKV